MSAERLIASFLRIANEDLAGARVLATAENRNAIYLCEQAAEKITATAAALADALARVGVDPRRADTPATTAGPVR